jgi:NADH-quinone oxidoreductase subunit G
VKITVDGQEVEVPEGALLIEALKLQGMDIPNFCYYQNLPAQASCRMCLVRIEKMPRLQPSCTTTVKEGMVIEASSPEIVDMRRGMLEFALANHPLDCPVCDRGGECELQDMVFKFGKVDARFTEEKHPTPEVDISPFIYNDAQRCIFCYRCTRVCDLWMDVGALAKLNRGSHETIGTFDGWLDCEHCGNCVDVCPTGTLMHTSYKYGPRPWDLDETETTCSYCADGCRVRLGSRDNVVHRAVARQGTGINEEYLCVKGRYGMDYVNADERLTSPLVRRNGQLVPATWDEALRHVAGRLSEVAQAKGPDSVAVLGSRRITNEGNFAMGDLARAIGTKNLSWVPDYDLKTFFGALGGKLATKTDIYGADLVFVLGGDPKEEQPLTAYFVLQAVLKTNTQIVAAAARRPRIAKRAKQFVHLRPGSEAALLSGLADGGSASSVADAVGCSAEEIDALREALVAAKKLVVMIGPEVRGAALEAAASLGGLLAAGERDVTYRPLVYYNNSIGAFDALTAGGGTIAWDELAGMLGDGVSALYCAGADLLNEPNGEELRDRLARLDLLVVQDIFMSDLAHMAEVVLPASTFAEQEGTFTNIAGQVQRVHKAIEPVGQSRPDWMIASQVARHLGSDPGYRNSASVVFKKLAEANPGYAAISYPKLAVEGAMQAERPVAGRAREAFVEALGAQAGAADRNAPMDDRPVSMGEGLFAIGTVSSHSRLLTNAFADGHAKGRPVEEELQT